VGLESHRNFRGLWLPPNGAGAVGRRWHGRVVARAKGLREAVVAAGRCVQDGDAGHTARFACRARADADRVRLGYQDGYALPSAHGRAPSAHAQHACSSRRVARRDRPAALAHPTQIRASDADAGQLGGQLPAQPRVAGQREAPHGARAPGREVAPRVCRERQPRRKNERKKKKEKKRKEKKKKKNERMKVLRSSAYP
jgi:hypothetical protein